MIDLYCERTSDSLFAEPMNLITNLGFIICAYFVFRLATAKGKLRLDVKILTSLVAAIGVGSFLFHMCANKLTQMLDVIPIFLFQIAFLFCYLKQVAKICSKNILLLVGLFIILSFVFTQFPHYLNNSLSYIPALVFLLGIGIYHKQRKQELENYILLSVTIFLFSLTLRTIDPIVCEYLFIGTHFFWHILNSIMLYILLKSLIYNIE